MTFFIVEKFIRILRGDDSAHGHSHAFSNSLDSSSESSTKTTEENSTITKAEPRIRVVALLNLVADFMHNITDGMSIGASFIAGPSIGFSTMIAVLIHEVYFFSIISYFRFHTKLEISLY